MGAEADVLPIPHVGMPALGAYLSPQLGTGDAPVAEHDHGHFLGNRRGQFPEQFHRGVHPGPALSGPVDAPGHGNGATPVDHADDYGGGLVAFERGINGQGQPAPERHQERTHRSNGAKQRLTSSSVWQGRARSLPSYNHSLRYWRRLFHLPQGESAEATAFWQALPARTAPQTHSTRPVNCGRER